MHTFFLLTGAGYHDAKCNYSTDVVPAEAGCLYIAFGSHLIDLVLLALNRVHLGWRPAIRHGHLDDQCDARDVPGVF